MDLMAVLSPTTHRAGAVSTASNQRRADVPVLDVNRPPGPPPYFQLFPPTGYTSLVDTERVSRRRVYPCPHPSSAPARRHPCGRCQWCKTATADRPPRAPALRNGASRRSAARAPSPVTEEPPCPRASTPILSPAYSPSSPSYNASPNTRTGGSVASASPDNSDSGESVDNHSQSGSEQDDGSCASGDDQNVPCSSDEENEASDARSDVTNLADPQPDHIDSALGTPNTPEGTTWTEMDTTQ